MGLQRRDVPVYVTRMPLRDRRLLCGCIRRWQQVATPVMLLLPFKKGICRFRSRHRFPHLACDGGASSRARASPGTAASELRVISLGRHSTGTEYVSQIFPTISEESLAVCGRSLGDFFQPTLRGRGRRPQSQPGNHHLLRIPVNSKGIFPKAVVL